MQAPYLNWETMSPARDEPGMLKPVGSRYIGVPMFERLRCDAAVEPRAVEPREFKRIMSVPPRLMPVPPRLMPVPPRLMPVPPRLPMVLQPLLFSARMVAPKGAALNASSLGKVLSRSCSRDSISPWKRGGLLSAVISGSSPNSELPRSAPTRCPQGACGPKIGMDIVFFRPPRSVAAGPPSFN